MSDNTMSINLQADIFNGKEEEWPKLPAMGDEDMDASTELGKVKKLAKMKNAIAMAYAAQCLSDTAMLKHDF